MWPFAPKWMSHLTSEALAAVGRITSERTLKKIVRSKAGREARMTAVSRIADQKFLLEVALLESDESIVKAAVSSIGDQRVLMGIVQSEAHSSARSAAVFYISDQDFLKGVAITDEDYAVRRSAVARITDTGFLLRLVEQETDDLVKLEAYKQLGITDKVGVLTRKINENNGCYRNFSSISALGTIVDQNTLFSIAQQSRDPVIQGIAASKLTDMELVKELLLYMDKRKNYKALRRILTCIKDVQILDEVVHMENFSGHKAVYHYIVEHKKLFADDLLRFPDLLREVLEYEREYERECREYREDKRRWESSLPYRDSFTDDSKDWQKLS
jgi:hypothetical protein